MKRKTKAQIEAAAKAALLQRIEDVYAGAMGDKFDAAGAIFPDHLQKVMCAVHSLFGGDDDKKYLTAHWNVDEYESPQKLTDFLFRHGVRA